LLAFCLAAIVTMFGSIIIFSSLFGVVQADVIPGGMLSIAVSALKRGADSFVPQIVETLKETVLPGQNDTLFWFEPIRVKDLSIGSYDVTLVPDQGVLVNLANMSNQLAQTRFMVHDLFNFVKCGGVIWAEAEGARYAAMNSVELDTDGFGKLVVKTPADGFDVGSVTVHHQMDTAGCEAVANVVHLLDGAIIDLIAGQLEKNLASIVATLIQTPANLGLSLLERPPAIGLFDEKFQLDNTFVGISYDDDRITHYAKGQYQSTKNPKESSLTPPGLSSAGDRDVVWSFSDFTINTLFESMYAEHVGENLIVLPLIKTLFDKECPSCPIVIKNTFSQRGQQSFDNDMGRADFRGMTWEVGALQAGDVVLPMVDLSINASLGQTFVLQQTAANAALKTTLSLENFQQKLLVSHIGEIDTSDLTRDIYAVALAGIAMLNADLPVLSIPVIEGVKMANEQISASNREVRVEADLVAASIVV